VDVVAVDVETERILRDDGDLMALAIQRDRPLSPAHGLADIGSDDAIVEGEAPIFAELDADTAIVE
jgi:hypothetical protein